MSVLDLSTLAAMSLLIKCGIWSKLILLYACVHSADLIHIVPSAFKAFTTRIRDSEKRE